MSLSLESLEVFVRAAEMRNFSATALHMRLPRSAVSQHIARLEQAVGARLFSRTTRSVTLTPEGTALRDRAAGLLASAEEIGKLFAKTSEIRGCVRIDLPVGLARSVVIPSMPEFLRRYPGLEIQLSATDRITDVVREGFDCVLRVGAMQSGDLVGVRVGAMTMTNCVSPSYVRNHGRPRSLADLKQHRLVHYSATLGSDVPVFEYVDRNRVRAVKMHAAITVNNADAFSAACVAGLGIAQIPRLSANPRLVAGELEEVLLKQTAPPLPVWLLHPHKRQVPQRVRVVFDWIARLVGRSLGEG